MQKTLLQLYLEHNEKVAHKWSSYLKFYDTIFFKYKQLPINILEIGVQNGGSLEIWTKYFENAIRIVGCDINPDCKNLRFSDPRIRIVIGDSTEEMTKNRILEQASPYHFVIDDGSHKTSDIIKNFALYFPQLAPNGLYLIEDLHCSYWQEFEGGLFYPYASIGFFKKLIDIINYQHWNVKITRNVLLKGFEKLYDIRLENETLGQIHKIEFVNSLCVITKANEHENELGEPVVAGIEATVIPEVKALGGVVSFPDQKENFWSNEPNEELIEEKLAQKLVEKEKEIERIKNSLSWKITKPIRLLQKLFGNSMKEDQ